MRYPIPRQEAYEGRWRWSQSLLFSKLANQMSKIWEGGIVGTL
jgi:hypothetical protein